MPIATAAAPAMIADAVHPAPRGDVRPGLPQVVRARASASFVDDDETKPIADSSAD